MSNAKGIRSQIKSVENTQKITKAMQMVAASKVKKVQDQMKASRPYTVNLLRIITHLVKATSSSEHHYLSNKAEIKKVAYIVVSTDRGLCGGLNINLFKALLKSIKKDKEMGREVVLSVFGKKGVGFAHRIGAQLVSVVEKYPDEPKISDLLGAVLPVLQLYEKGEVQLVHIASNQFINAMSQKPLIGQLLPATVVYTDEKVASYSWDYIYDSNPKKYLDELLKRYLETVVMQFVLENIASEMSARMIAMQSASDNAGNLIDELKLKYNKARQAAITQELTEIVAGADAV